MTPAPVHPAPVATVVAFAHGFEADTGRAVFFEVHDPELGVVSAVVTPTAPELASLFFIARGRVFSDLVGPRVRDQGDALQVYQDHRDALALFLTTGTEEADR